MKYQYKCSFNGRLVSSLGVTYNFDNVIVTAADEKEALLECYKTHEHISNFKCEKGKSMKKQLVKHFADKLVSFGYTVYIAKTGDYGFYTDGKRCISFGGVWNFSLDVSGNYKSSHCGTGWQIENEICDFDKSDAEKWIKANPPHWATNGEQVKLTTPEQHLQTYGESSGYVEYKGESE